MVWLLVRPAVFERACARPIRRECESGPQALAHVADRSIAASQSAVWRPLCRACSRRCRTTARRVRWHAFRWGWRLSRPSRSRAAEGTFGPGGRLPLARGVGGSAFSSLVTTTKSAPLLERGRGWVYQVGHQTTRPALPRDAAVLQPPSGRTPSTPPTGRAAPGGIARAHQATPAQKCGNDGRRS